MKRPFDKFSWLYSLAFLFCLYLGIAVFVTVFAIRVEPGGGSINNFQIFRWSYSHLVHGIDLYELDPAHHEDYYKYSPTFALLMAPLYLLPNAAALLLWTFLNTFAPFVAVRCLNISDRAKAFVLLFICFELLGSTQNTQSNGLTAALMIGTLAAFERKQTVLAALCVCLGFYIKVFGAAAGILFLFYERKPRFLIACALWSLALGVLPLPVTGLHGMIDLYQSWLHRMANDPAHEMNISLMTMTQKWFGAAPPDIAFLVPGFVLLVLPLARRAVRESEGFRLLYLASLLVWVVIFNHKAESPTFVIAMAGVALWALTEPPSHFRTALLCFVFIFTGMSYSDLFPAEIRKRIIGPYRLKALPCIIAWGVMAWQLLLARQRSLQPNAARPALDSAQSATQR